jgi:hypothetical protein
MEGSISGWYNALGISERSVSRIAEINCTFRASTFSIGVVTVSEGVTKLLIDGG